jgi:Protein of unknown function (DUF3147)
MSPISFTPSSLKEGRLYEYLIRFALGGTATVFTGFISSRCGASIGGLFLALPAIFCASATLIEKHEIRRKREAGLDGRRRGEASAALESAGAVLGAVGMLAFAVTFSLTVEESVPTAFIGASLPGWSSRLRGGASAARCGRYIGRPPPRRYFRWVRPHGRKRPHAESQPIQCILGGMTVIPSKDAIDPGGTLGCGHSLLWRTQVTLRR